MQTYRYILNTRRRRDCAVTVAQTTVAKDRNNYRFTYYGNVIIIIPAVYRASETVRLSPQNASDNRCATLVGSSSFVEKIRNRIHCPSRAWTYLNIKYLIRSFTLDYKSRRRLIPNVFLSVQLSDGLSAVCLPVYWYFALRLKTIMIVGKGSGSNEYYKPTALETMYGTRTRHTILKLSFS